jgi:hypothetical protein
MDTWSLHLLQASRIIDPDAGCAVFLSNNLITRTNMIADDIGEP